MKILKKRPPNNSYATAKMPQPINGKGGSRKPAPMNNRTIGGTNSLASKRILPRRCPPITKQSPLH